MATKREQIRADKFFHFPLMLTSRNVGPDQTEEKLDAQCRVFTEKALLFDLDKRKTVQSAHTPRTTSISNSESISGLSDSCSVT